jgi:hypothetical protein
MPSKQGKKKLMGAIALTIGFATVALQPTVLSAQNNSDDRRLDVLYPGQTNHSGGDFDKGHSDDRGGY